MESRKNTMQACIDMCLDCYAICVETLNYCLEQGGKYATPEQLMVLDDCAKICHVNADFLLRNSPFHIHTCEACVEICNASAENCERGDEQMRHCADTCRRCAEVCADMAKLAQAEAAI